CCQDETRQPLAGALINAFNPVSRVRNSTRTNELGEYRLELPVSSDPYIIEVWHRDQGKALQIQETLAAAGSVVNRDMEVPAPAVLSGRICRNGQGVGGAVVSAWCISDNNYLSSKSDAEGIYRLSLQPGESYRISVWSKESGEKSFNITAAPDMTQDFELERLNTVRGRVELASGSKQVANAWVQLVDSSGKSRGAFSEEDGAFELQAPAGKYMLLVTKKGLFQNVVSEWNVGEVPVDTGSVSMDDAQAVITGFTSDPNNSPVAFAIVWARSSQGDVMGTRSDADGHYSLALYPGPWTLMAVHDNWQEISHSLTVSEAATSEANLVFTDAQLLDSPGLAHLKTEQGGLIKDQQNGMELLLPPGSTAIESEMSIVTARNDAVVPSSSQQPVISFDFSAYTAEGAAFKGILDQSMEARIRYYRSDLEVAGMVDNSAEESLLALSYYDEAAGDWVEVPAVQDVQDPDERGGGIFVVRSDHFTKFSVVKPSKLVLLGMRTDSSQQPGGGSGGTGGSGGGSSSVSNGSKPEETAQPAVSVNQNANAGPSRAVTAFVDTAGHWAAGIIAKMAQRGVIQGSEGRAYPDRPVNRAEFAVFLCRLLNLPAVQADLPFKDVPRDSWYYQSLQNLYIKGLMSGVANDQMAPEMMMTREQVAAILGRVANQVLNMQPSNKRVSSFKDKNQMASWSVEAIQQLSAAGIISGYPDGTFGPLRPITRAESLVCLEKMFPTGAAAR
ncbi:MAG: S-layer homology domain-containing protein, partial [Syntrophomonas sp.]